MRNDDDLMLPAEVAEYFHTSEQGLAARRYRKDGPPFIKVGRSVYYRWGDVREWLAANMRS